MSIKLTKKAIKLVFLEELKGKLTLTSSLKTIAIDIAIENPPQEKLKLPLPLPWSFSKNGY